MIYKDHNKYSMYAYDPKDKDDEFIGFKIAYFRFEFLNFTIALATPLLNSTKFGLLVLMHESIALLRA